MSWDDPYVYPGTHVLRNKPGLRSIDDLETFERMQAGMHKSLGSSLSNLMATDGFMGLYRGFGITIFREVPFSLLQFPMYEKLKSIIRSSRSATEMFRPSKLRPAGPSVGPCPPLRPRRWT